MLRSFDEDTELPDDSYPSDYDSYALAAARLSSTSTRAPFSTLSPLENRTTQIKVGRLSLEFFVNSDSREWKKDGGAQIKMEGLK